MYSESKLEYKLAKSKYLKRDDERAKFEQSPKRTIEAVVSPIHESDSDNAGGSPRVRRSVANFYTSSSSWGIAGRPGVLLESL